MHHSRRRERPEECAEPLIGSYHELYFDDVAEGVAYCQGIVPHVVPPFGSLSEGQPSCIAVWLHVPRHGESRTRGCFLYMSQAVHEALERVGRSPRTTCTISRVALPDTSVLVFGYDSLDARSEPREVVRTRGAGTTRVSRYDRALDEADAVIR